MPVTRAATPEIKRFPALAITAAAAAAAASEWSASGHV
jgi:hypothetical protein